MVVIINIFNASNVLIVCVTWLNTLYTILFDLHTSCEVDTVILFQFINILKLREIK